MRKTFWAPDQDSVDRAQRSRAGKRADTFSGVDILDGTVKPFIGTVWGVEDMGEKTPTGRRWRISIEIPD